MAATAPRTDTASDEALARRTLAGDISAFEAIVERHRLVVRRVAARIVGEDEADDVAQDAFLRAFHRVGRFRAEASFRSWLLRITHNAALDALARRRAQPVDDVGDLEDEASPGRPRTPADQLEERERRDRLAAKLRLMQPTHRAVLVLRDLEGLSYEEIATITEAPLGSVKGRLHRARRELIDILRANTYDWGLPQ
ncbi:MAG: sigma-70 family RNA polymerase sigma factor [Actinobacteria bacterium]|nr:sigma-70 family RNA polymerase sigma factor [Actinomycetota bacterium]